MTSGGKSGMTFSQPLQVPDWLVDQHLNVWEPSSQQLMAEGSNRCVAGTCVENRICLNPVIGEALGARACWPEAHWICDLMHME